MELGCWLDLPSPFIAEIVGQAGFGFTVIDLEHGPMSMETASTCMMALKGTGTEAIVRVSEGTEGRIKRALDAGAAGVMVPRVESAEEAERMVQWFRYPPRGRRGAAQSVIRAAGYGREAERYTDRASGLLLALQIESAAGLAAAEDIAAIDGVSMLFFGPADWSAEAGVAIDSPETREAAARMAAIAKAAGRAAGTVLFPGASVASLGRMGMTHVSVTGDVAALVSGFDAALGAARGALNG